MRLVSVPMGRSYLAVYEDLNGYSFTQHNVCPYILLFIQHTSEAQEYYRLPLLSTCSVDHKIFLYFQHCLQSSLSQRQ